MEKALKPEINSIQAGLGVELSSTIDVHAFDKLGSTNEWLTSHRANSLERLAQGRAQLCVTDWQQAGMGRRGKAWQTQPGNITFSVMTRLPLPASELLGLSLVTGLAVSRTLEIGFRMHPMLKWPNDIIVDNKKLGGLLTEIVSAESREECDTAHAPVLDKSTSSNYRKSDVVTGIGLNINHNDDVLAMGIGATSFLQMGTELSRASRDVLVGNICAKVMAYHERFVTSGWASFAPDWEKRDWLSGKPIEIQGDNSTEHAVARGVNEQGALLIESANELQPLYGGNVSIRPTL